MSQPRTRIKTGRASLIGGIAVAIASFVLWAAIAHELGVDTTATLIAGLLVAAGIGAWIGSPIFNNDRRDLWLLVRTFPHRDPELTRDRPAHDSV